MAEEAKLNSLVDVRRLFYTIDEDSSGSVSKEEIGSILEDSMLASCMTDLQLPVNMSGDELFCLFNSDCEQELSVTAFMQNAVRLLESNNPANTFEWHCMLILHINRVMQEVRDTKTQQKDQQATVMQELRVLREQQQAIAQHLGVV